MSGMVPPSSVPSPARRNRWLDRLMLLLFLTMVLLPLFGSWPARERLRWQAAAALSEYELHGRGEDLRELVAITKQLPNDIGLRLRIVELLVQENQAREARELLEPIAELAQQGEIAIGSFKHRILRQQANILWLSGDDLNSLRTVKDLIGRLRQEDQYRESILNELAYQRALTRLELDEAEVDMRTLVYMKRATLNQTPPQLVSFRTTVLMACALLALELEPPPQVLPLLDAEIADARLLAKRRTDELLAAVDSELTAREEFNDATRESLDRLRQFEAQSRADLAALLLARAYHLDRRGEREASQRDRREVAALSVDGDAWLAGLPDHWFFLDMLVRGGSFLDTYAVVLLEQGRPYEAVREQQLAILAGELLLASYDSPLQNSPDLGEDIQILKARTRRTLAALYLHYADMLEKLDLKNEAEVQFKKMEALGFNRDQLVF